MILVAVLFQTIVILILGIMFTYFAFKLFNMEANILPDKQSEDKFEEDVTVPIDQFKPKKGEKLKVKFERDNINEI